MTDKKKSNQSVFTGTTSSRNKPILGEPDKIDSKMTNEKKPRVKEQSFEEITAQSVITLPKNQVRPVYQRIFCIAVDPGEMKTEGGVIIPTSFNQPEAKSNQKVKLMRYFVVDVADDCTIRFKKNRNDRTVPSSLPQDKIERGDEVFPFIPPDAVDFVFPEVFDFYNNERYIVFHETELGGVGVSPLISKEE